jgi:hypothetical protein
VTLILVYEWLNMRLYLRWRPVCIVLWTLSLLVSGAFAARSGAGCIAWHAFPCTVEVTVTHTHTHTRLYELF